MNKDFRYMNEGIRKDLRDLCKRAKSGEFAKDSAEESRAVARVKELFDMSMQEIEQQGLTDEEQPVRSWHR